MINNTNELYKSHVDRFLNAKHISSQAHQSGNNMLLPRLWYYILAKKKKHDICFILANDNAGMVLPDCDTAVVVSTNGSEERGEKAYPLIATYLSNRLKTAVVITELKNSDMDTLTIARPNRILTIAFEGRFRTNFKEMLSKLEANLVTVFPKLFPDDVKMSKDNVNLIKKCAELLNQEDKSCEDLFYQLGIEQIKEEIETFVDERNYECLRDCISYSQKSRKEEMRHQVETWIQECERLLEDYNTAVKRYNEYNAYYESLLMGTNDEEVALLRSILFNSPNIEVETITQNEICYSVRDKIVIFNKKDYENKIATSDVNKIGILNSIPEVEDKKKMLKFLNLLFIDKKYKIRTINFFKLSLDERSTLSVVKKKIVDSHNFGHPHGQAFGCVGTYAKEWNEALAAGNLAAAIQYTISYTCHLNWNDFTVCNQMINNIWRKKNDKFLEDKDGNLFSPAEIMEVEADT